MKDEELQKAWQARIEPPGGTPVTPEELARLLAREGSEAERLELLDRALATTESRRDFELLRAISAAEPGARSPGLRRWVVPLTLAASMLIAVSGWLLLRGRPDDSVRAPDAKGAPRLIAPAEDVRQPAGPVSFSWHSDPGVDRYRVEVLTDAGTVAATTETSDTVATLTVPVAGSYRWLVVSVLPDGLEAPSRPRSLLIAP